MLDIHFDSGASQTASDSVTVNPQSQVDHGDSQVESPFRLTELFQTLDSLASTYGNYISQSDLEGDPETVSRFKDFFKVSLNDKLEAWKSRLPKLTLVQIIEVSKSLIMYRDLFNESELGNDNSQFGLKYAKLTTALRLDDLRNEIDIMKKDIIF